MSIIATLRRILNDTPGTAHNIDYNFQVLEDYINTAVVTTDGLSGITGAPLVVPEPIADNHAATKGYVDKQWFPGMITEFGGDALPVSMVDEWELCMGGLRSSTDPKYMPLFAVIGNKFGTDGLGNFRLPDYRGKVSIGRSDLGTDAIFDTVGKSAGKRDSELLIHQHSVPLHGHGNTFSVTGAGGHSHTATGSGTATAGGHSHPSNGGHTEVMFRDGAYNTGFRIGQAVIGAGDLAVTWGPLAGGDHTHALNVSGGTPADTGGHTHSIGGSVSDAAAFATTGSIAAGTTLTDKNLQPYLVVNKIIKL